MYQLDHHHLDLRLLAQRTGEADLRGVVSSYSVREVRATYTPSQIAQGSDLMRTDTASKRGYALILFTVSDTNFRDHPFLWPR